MFNSPVNANADEYEAGQEETEYSKESRYSTPTVTKDPLDVIVPDDFQGHHQECYLKKKIISY